MKTFRGYFRFLCCKWILPYLRSSVKQSCIHVVFDDSGRHRPSPKSFERARRDSSRKQRACKRMPVEDDVILPHDWQAFIGNR
jgi:hypothetical protein